jgi:hypothetical protein
LSASLRDREQQQVGRAFYRDPRQLLGAASDVAPGSVAQGPVRWRSLVTIGQPGDPTNDATKPWPAKRRQVQVGTLTINSLQTEESRNARDVNFAPPPEGIAASDAPLLAARSAVYARSYQRRTGEPHQPSEVNTATAEAAGGR